MNNQKNKIITNNTTVSKVKPLPTREPVHNGDKYCDQFMEMVLDTGRYALHTIKENAGDYKCISEDKNISPIAKAIGKRKVLAADIGIGISAVGSLLGLIWLTKKVFAI